MTKVGCQVSAESDKSKAFYVVMGPELLQEDRDRANKAAHIAIFKPELAVARMSSQNIGPVRPGITATVKNEGAVTVSGRAFELRKNDENGPW